MLERLNDEEGYAAALWWLSQMHYSRYNHTVALELCKKAFEIQERLGDRRAYIPSL